MRRSEPPLLGIDLSDHEIRVVKVAVRSGRLEGVESASAPLPMGVITLGVVNDPATVTVALRRVVESMGVSEGTRAVVGIHSEQTLTRILTIPPCPDAELPTIIEGELEHQGHQSYEGAPQDFFVFQARAEANEGMRAVAVLSADATVTQGLSSVVQGAGLRVEAIEPIHVAMLRAASAALKPNASTCFLIVCPTITALSYFVDGRLVSLRRLEFGTANLLRPSVEGAPARLDLSEFDSLSTQVLQTLEYFRRDGDEEIECICLAASDPGLETMAAMFERRFGIPTRFAEFPADLHSLSCVAAYGLAVRSLPGAFDVPKLDFFSTQRQKSSREAKRRNFIGSLAVSATALAIGLIGWSLYGHQINLIDLETRTVLNDLKTIQTEIDRYHETQDVARQRYAVLRKEGVPLGAVMDVVVGSIDSDIGIKSVSVDTQNKIVVEGEARDELAVIRVTQRLQSNPILTDMELGQFVRPQGAVAGPLTFQITGSALTTDRIRMAGGRS